MTANDDGQGHQDPVDVRVNTSIGKPGCIVDLRPEEHDFARERDMTHLSEEEARELRDKLDKYLSDEDTEIPSEADV